MQDTHTLSPSSLSLSRLSINADDSPSLYFFFLSLVFAHFALSAEYSLTLSLSVSNGVELLSSCRSPSISSINTFWDSPHLSLDFPFAFPLAPAPLTSHLTLLSEPSPSTTLLPQRARPRPLVLLARSAPLATSSLTGRTETDHTFFPLCAALNKSGIISLYLGLCGPFCVPSWARALPWLLLENLGCNLCGLSWVPIYTYFFASGCEFWAGLWWFLSLVHWYRLVPVRQRICPNHLGRFGNGLCRYTDMLGGCWAIYISIALL
jgi:hypothetical protein